MSIITISSDSYEVGREIAEKTAKILNYKCLGREILSKAAEKHGIPEANLSKALDEVPSLLGISAKLRERHLAYIKAYVLNLLLDDNTVCYGLAAHLYLTDISHVLKVGIISNPKKIISRIASEKNISEEKAENFIKKRKEQCRRTSLQVFHVDETDASQYDLVINLGQIDRKRAMDIITETVNDRKFKPITYSLNCIEDIELENRVKAVLLEHFSNIKVLAKRGTVVVETKAFKFKKEKKCNSIKEMAGKLSGVVNIEVHTNSYIVGN